MEWFKYELKINKQTIRSYLQIFSFLAFIEDRIETYALPEFFEKNNNINKKMF